MYNLMPVFLDKRKPFYTALQKDLFGHIFENQVRDLKLGFLSLQWSEMKNLSAYHQEDFLRNRKLMLILVPLLREV